MLCGLGRETFTALPYSRMQIRCEAGIPRCGHTCWLGVPRRGFSTSPSLQPPSPHPLPRPLSTWPARGWTSPAVRCQARARTWALQPPPLPWAAALLVQTSRGAARGGFLVLVGIPVRLSSWLPASPWAFPVAAHGSYPLLTLVKACLTGVDR